MADKHDAAFLRVDDAVGRLDVALERQRRVLDDRDLLSAAAKRAVDALPARAIDETSVDEDDGNRI